MRKGQSSVELLSFVFFAGIVLIGMASVSFFFTGRLDSQKRASGGEQLCDFIASQANAAASFGDGFQSSFDLPYAATQYGYQAGFLNSERRVFVSWDGGGCSRPLLSNVSGSLSSGRNFVHFEGGVVVLN